MKTLCAFCGKTISETRENASLLTHGICITCESEYINGMTKQIQEKSGKIFRQYQVRGEDPKQKTTYNDGFLNVQFPGKKKIEVGTYCSDDATSHTDIHLLF